MPPRMPLRQEYDGIESTLYQSSIPSATSDAAVVFIHGFYGNLTDVWKVMRRELDKVHPFDAIDFHVVSYASSSTPESLGYFLSGFLEQLWKKLNGPRRVILVSHSLGSVLSRLAILEGIHRGSPWTACCRQVYLAPAHLGTRVSALVHALHDNALMPDPLRLMHIMFEHRHPAYECLKQDSPFLRDLKTNVEHFAYCPGVVANITMFGQREYVVYRGTFGPDPRPKHIPRRTHSSILRVSSKYQAPIGAIAEAAR